MSIQTVIPSSFIESLNNDQETIEIQESVEDFRDSQEELPPEPEPDMYAEWDAEDEDGKPEWLEDIEEGHEAGDRPGMSEDEMEGFSLAFVDFMLMGKSFLADYYDAEFGRILRKKFDEDKRLHIIICEMAETEGGLTIDGLANALEKVKTHSDKFNVVTYPDLLEVGNDYRKLKKRYQPSEIKDYQKDGLKRYFKVTLVKYFGEVSPDPMAMLCLYLVITFGFDGYNLWMNHRTKSKEA